jgi:hypothetical protein
MNVGMPIASVGMRRNKDASSNEADYIIKIYDPKIFISPYFILLCKLLCSKKCAHIFIK